MNQSTIYPIYRRVASRCTTKRRESPLEILWNTSAMAYALENSLVVSNTWSTSWGGQSCRILRDVSRWKRWWFLTSVQWIPYVQIYQGKKMLFIITCMLCVVFPDKPSHFCFIRSSYPFPAIPAIQVIRDLINSSPVHGYSMIVIKVYQPFPICTIPSPNFPDSKPFDFVEQSRSHQPSQPFQLIMTYSVHYINIYIQYIYIYTHDSILFQVVEDYSILFHDIFLYYLKLFIYYSR